MSVQALTAAREAYVESPSGSSARSNAFNAMRNAAEQLYQQAEFGTMPLAEQQEIMYAAAVAHEEGHQAQMDIAANAAAGAPLTRATLTNALAYASTEVRMRAMTLAAQLWPNR